MRLGDGLAFSLSSAVLLLSLLCGFGPCQALDRRNARQLLQSSRFSPPYNVCTSDWAPIVTCNDIPDPSEFTGFQVALWREVAKDLGWRDEDWTFTCVANWTAMIEDLVNPDGLCSFAAAGVEVSLPNIMLGLKFSWPIYKSGFHLLISSRVEEGGMWAFAEAFHWSVWLVLGATAGVVSLLITAAEYLAYGNAANRKGLRGWSWYTMGKMVQIVTHVGDPKTWASRVLVLGYAFLALIMVHLFTATTANKLTMQRLANDITSKADLPGKKVESWEPYVPLLRKYSIDADAMPWDVDADTQAMLDNLRSGKYKALILDSPVVQYLAAQAEPCDLYPVGDPFETFNLAIGFPPDAPAALPANVSASIVRLQTTTAMLDRLENQYVKANGGSGHSCSNANQDSSTGHSADPQIHMEQVAGLWFIQLFTLTIAVLLAVTHNVVSNRGFIAAWLARATSRVAPSDGTAAATPANAAAAAAVATDGGNAINSVVSCDDGMCDDDNTAEISPGAGSGKGGKVGVKQPQQPEQPARQPAALRVEAENNAVQAFGSPKIPGEVGGSLG